MSIRHVPREKKSRRHILCLKISLQLFPLNHLQQISIPERNTKPRAATEFEKIGINADEALKPTKSRCRSYNLQYCLARKRQARTTVPFHFHSFDMDGPHIHPNVYSKGRYVDNIFVHTIETRGEVGQQLAKEQGVVVPDEYPVPEFLGFFPSRSPSQAPTARVPHFSADELSTTFAASCPSLSFDRNQDSRSWNIDETSDSRPVVSLRKILPLKRNKTLAHNYDWSVGHESSAYTAEASLVWFVVTLGLGFWLTLMCCIVKATTAKFNKGSSKQLPGGLRRPSFEDYGVKEYDNNLSLGKPSFSTKFEESIPNNKMSERLDEQTRKIQPKLPSVCMGMSHDECSDQDKNIEANRTSRGERVENDKAFLGRIVVENNKMETRSCNEEGRFQPEGHAQPEPYWSKIQKMRNSCDKKQAKGGTFFLTPILPVLSDLSLPPGLSKSSSSSSSSSSYSSSIKYTRGATDEASIEVLATDDIYTGAHISNETRTPVINYLSYCLEEYDSVAVSNRRNDRMNFDNDSDILLLSSESMDSGSSKSSDNSHPLASRNSQYLERAMLSISGMGTTNGDIDLVELARSQTGAKNNFHRTQEEYFHRGERGRDDVKLVAGGDGKYSPMNQIRNSLYSISSNQALRNKLIGQSDNLAMLLQCDDSNTTVDLLADSDSNDSSEDQFDSKDVADPIISHQEKTYNSNKLLFDPEVENMAGEKNNQERPNSTPRNPIDDERIAESSTRYTEVDDTTGKRSFEGTMTRPVTEDLEALMFATHEKSNVCDAFVKKMQSPKTFSSSHYLGSIRGIRIIMITTCVLLILSVVLFLARGISPLYKFQKGISLEFDSLMDDLTRLFNFENDDLYAFLGELDRRRQRVYLNFNDHCPKISSRLCLDSTAAFSSCNLEGIPFREAWNELLLAFDKMGPLLESPSESNSHYLLSSWWITVKDQSLSVSSTLRNRFRNEAKKLKWCLSIALMSGVGMSLLAMTVFFVVVLPMCEKRWDFNWRERLPYFRFGEDNPSWNINRRFSFCTGRIFAVIFWTLFGAIWLLGIAFTAMTVATVDVCDSEYPNAVLGNEFEKWEEMIPGFDFYITDFWQQQLRYCARAHTSSGGNNNIFPGELTDRINLLSSVIRPVHNITVGLQKLSSSGFYPHVCGHDVDSLLQSIQDMELQLCSDAEFHANAFKNLMSCDNSSWLPLYNRMVRETICKSGLGSLAWTVATQVAILFFSLVLWAFRSAFLVSRNKIIFDA